MSKRVIYYYQTFIGLEKILEQKPLCVTHIIISSIHFGYIDDKPYIHLNDNSPDNEIFDKLWSDIKIASNLGIKIILMVGGAGGAYTALFSNFNTFYNMLKDEIKKRPYINGIDLDIEEGVNILYVQSIITQINSDFGKDFIITMAPLGYSLENDVSGMGGFCYKDLYNSIEGQRINWFNGQFYSDYTEQSYSNAINNGYPASKVVFGMTSSEFNEEDFDEACNCVKKLSNKYRDFGGVFDWEYCNAPPDKTNPSIWSLKMSQSIKKISKLKSMFSIKKR